VVSTGAGRSVIEFADANVNEIVSAVRAPNVVELSRTA